MATTSRFVQQDGSRFNRSDMTQNTRRGNNDATVLQFGAGRTTNLSNLSQNSRFGNNNAGIGQFAGRFNTSNLTQRGR